MTDLVLIRVKALAAFTKTTQHGQFHGNPEGRSDRTRFPSVPEYVVESLFRTGKAEPLGDEGIPPPPILPQLDHDGDGKPGGSVTAQGDDVPALRARYKELVGKNPFNGWDAAELSRRIAELAPDDDVLGEDDGAPI